MEPCQILSSKEIIINIIIKGFLYFLLLINDPLLSQIALPSFHGAQKPHTIASSGSQTFSYTGSQQTFTVPSGVSTITIKAWGAQGGGEPADGLWGDGGKGGYSTGDANVSAGSTIYIVVGQQGFSTHSSYAYNGGGGGGAGDQDGGGGGGGSGYICGVSNGSTIAGNASMPNPDGGTMTGREGNGLIIITW